MSKTTRVGKMVFWIQKCSQQNDKMWKNLPQSKCTNKEHKWEATGVEFELLKWQIVTPKKEQAV